MSDLPDCSSGDVIRVLERAGFVYVRTKGDHHIYWKVGMRRPVPVPHPKKSIYKDLLRRIIREAGLTREEFIRLLQQ